MPMDIQNANEQITTVTHLKKKRRSMGIVSACGFLLLIPLLLLASELTELKEFQDFTSHDWLIFTPIICAGIIIIVVSFIFFFRFLLLKRKIYKIQRNLYQTLLRTSPVGPGNALKLFIANNVFSPMRLTVFGCPDSGNVYYTMETVNRYYEIECVYTSKIYPSFNDIEPPFKGTTEIPLPEES